MSEDVGCQSAYNMAFLCVFFHDVAWLCNIYESIELSLFYYSALVNFCSHDYTKNVVTVIWVSAISAQET